MLLMCYLLLVKAWNSIYQKWIIIPLVIHMNIYLILFYFSPKIKNVVPGTNFILLPQANESKSLYIFQDPPSLMALRVIHKLRSIDKSLGLSFVQFP